MQYLLRYLFDGNPFSQSETSMSIKEVIECEKCISNETLCWFHSESLKSSIIADVQNWINYGKKIEEDEDFKRNSS